MTISSASTIVEVLAAKHAASVDELIAAGVSEPTVRRHIAAGLLIRLGRGVVGLADDNDPRRRNRVGALRVHQTAVLSHQTAAEHWGIPFHAPAVHLTVGPGARQRRGGVEIALHRTRWLPDTDVTWHDGHPFTTPARTLCDLVTETSDAEHYDWLLRRTVGQVVEPAAFIRCHDGLADRGRPGTLDRQAAIDRLMGTEHAAMASDLERLFYELMTSAGIEGIVYQFTPPWSDGRTGIVDAAIPDCLIVIELDGLAWHATRERFDKDRARSRRAGESGWCELRFTWNDVVRRPAEVIASVRAAVAAYHATRR
ncbi:MAG: type IV toxin-antitoxin system AbiEi family antitoxin domain-containing protein [Acidimicrobiales bacterium]